MKNGTRYISHCPHCNGLGTIQGLDLVGYYMQCEQCGQDWIVDCAIPIKDYQLVSEEITHGILEQNAQWGITL